MNGFRRGVSLCACLVFILCLTLEAPAQQWTDMVRGSWVRQGKAQPGDITLVAPGHATQITIFDNANSAVKQAAVFLSQDITKLTGAKAQFNNALPPAGQVSIRLITLGDGNDLPPGAALDKLKGKWEAYQILTTPDTVWCIGSDFRGTAYAVYTLSERLGIDPLYLWTGFTPERHDELVLKATNAFFDSPTFKYRGFFHDDEDILPRPFNYSGWPLRTGDVPLEWYKKFFETALRLRMNMVAPYTRVHRRFEVQKTASDWGLIYTSHHYDIMLSNPYGYHHYKLAEKRGVSGDWNWKTNREGMLKYWAGGVEENGSLNCIWPVGLRGTDDYAYPFPKGTTKEEQNRVFQDVIKTQIAETERLLPADKKPAVFHFTLYGEMLDKYLAGKGEFDMPSNVILVWCDDNDGRMRALPKDPGKWKHGVYYHLAYWGPVAKQAMHVVPPVRVAGEFKKIVERDATEFMLVNVSELREFVMEARMLAEICWDAKTALADTPQLPISDRLLPHVPTEAKEPLPPDAPSPSAKRYVNWWCREYFGKDAAPQAAECYEMYYDLINRWDMQWYAGDKAVGAIDSLIEKLAGKRFNPARADTLPTLLERQKRYQKVFKLIEQARAKMNRQQRQFFFDHLELPLLITGKQTDAAVILVRAMDEPDRAKVWTMCQEAMKPLEELEVDISRAEHPPFEAWYRDTFIRHPLTGLNPHKPYYALRAFLSSGGTQKVHIPREWFHPDVDRFLPVLHDDHF